MTDTPRSALPELAAAQAQKHVTHNDALLQLDALVCCRILDRDLSTPPSSPADGDAYIVKATGTGDWAGEDGNIAFCVDGAWRFYAPFAGLTAFVADDLEFLIYDGTDWADLATVLSLENLPMIGINTTADSTNKLAVKSAAILFDNIADDVQVKLNKDGAADTASFLFQTGYSGRAEIGTTGDDDFHFKVSSDGSTWHDAINIDGATGNAAIGGTATSSAKLQISSGTPGTAADGIQFGDGPTNINLYRLNSTTLKCDGYIYGGTGIGGTTAQFNTAYPLSSVDLAIRTRGGAANNIVFSSNGTTPGETMRCTGTGHVQVSGTVRTSSYTVSALPSAATVGAGARAFVTDATATTFASTVAGGGTNKVPVVSDGTNWIIG